MFSGRRRIAAGVYQDLAVKPTPDGQAMQAQALARGELEGASPRVTAEVNDGS
jgi:hypothetical protein